MLGKIRAVLATEPEQVRIELREALMQLECLRKRSKRDWDFSFSPEGLNPSFLRLKEGLTTMSRNVSFSPHPPTNKWSTFREFVKSNTY
jgi:hypothetical protein